MKNGSRNPLAVLVHGAWADGSNWKKVIETLHRKDFDVLSAQIPLTSLADDVAAVRRALAVHKRPLILVGHSYGGAVITAAGAGNADVKALVYIAAIVPDEGETVGEVFQRVAPHPQAPQLKPDANGFLWVDVEAFRQAIAPDAAVGETALLAATQKPIAVQCLGEPMSKPAWREKPTWFLIAESDRMVSPDTQRMTAERMASKVVSLPVDHTPLLSAPDAVSDLIVNAAQAV